jgi:hypothetical protein
MEKADSFNHDDKGVDELMQPEERRVSHFKITSNNFKISSSRN